VYNGPFESYLDSGSLIRSFNMGIVLWGAMFVVVNKTMLGVTMNHTTTIEGLHSYHKIRKIYLFENKIHHFGSKVAKE
jgi:hypothetical protein